MKAFFSGQPTSSAGGSSEDARSEMHESDGEMEVKQPKRARLTLLEHHKPEEVVLYRDTGGLSEYAVMAAPTVFSGPEGCRTITKDMIKNVSNLGTQPLALLFKLGANNSFLTDEEGHPVAVYTLYLTQTGPQQRGAARPILPVLPPPVLKDIKARLQEAGADGSALLLEHEGIVYPVLPQEKPPKRKLATKRAAPPDDPLGDDSKTKIEKHVVGMAEALGLHVTKRRKKEPPVSFSADATFEDITKAYKDFLQTDQRVPDNQRKAEVISFAPEATFEDIENAYLEFIKSDQRVPPGKLEDGAAITFRPSASFVDIAGEYMTFLETDPRVPEVTRRIAAGLAPHTQETKKHFGIVDARVAPPEGKPYDAKDMLVRAKTVTWESPEKQRDVKAAINWSVFTWNQLFLGVKRNPSEDSSS